MAVTYGFYNSLNKDRMYNAEQMSSIFNGIITDGVFSTIGDALMTVAGTGMQVIVKPGRAWFNNTWTLNDAQLPLDVPASDVSLTRIDAVILEVNSAVATRANSIKVLKGTPSANPTKPALSATETLHQYALAYITVGAGVTSITAANIEINVGKTSCPFITSVLQQTDITDLFNQWNAEFTTWFENVQAQLSGNVAANLQRQIDLLKVATGSKITDSTASAVGIAQDSSVDAALNLLGLSLGMMKNNKGYVTVTVYMNGTTTGIGGVLIDGVTDADKNSVYTNENGVASGYISEGTQTISISNYGDIEDISQQITIEKGSFHSAVFNVTLRNFLKLTSSKNIRFSDNVSTVDATIGGGGAGGASDYASSNAGGGGGYAIEQKDININSRVVYPVIVGAGGKASDRAEGGTSVGGAGGASSFAGYSASGGNAPVYKAHADKYGVMNDWYFEGGIGNGNGGSGGIDGSTNSPKLNPGSNGIGKMYTSFTTEDTSYGGGGGCGAPTGRYAGRYEGPGGAGGSPGGGAGGESSYTSSSDSFYPAAAIGGNGVDGKGGGAGGGGTYIYGSNHYWVGAASGKGGSGCVAIRMHLKTAS